MENRVYFKNLNALRFFAATAVIFHHVEQYKYWAKLPNIWGNTAIDAFGHKAVSFFFVLSGFLITYLLLVEEKKTGEINIRNFYLRRVLRIWPLYYLIVILSLFIIPFVFDLTQLGVAGRPDNFGLIALLLLLVLPNVVRTFSPVLVGGNQLWSIGVEEQFYLVWPVLVRWFSKHMLLFLVGFIVLKISIGQILELFITPESPAYFQKSLRLWILLQVEQMAIGAIGAWLLFTSKKSALKLIYNPYIFAIAIASFAGLFVMSVHHWWMTCFEAIIFIVIIMNLSTNPSIKLSLENKVFSVLGNISYGIYMYHTVCITVCIFTLRYFEIETSNYTLFNVLLYTMSIIMTIAVAYLSYEFFEKKFLTLKERFMIVKSGKKAEDTSPSEPIIQLNRIVETKS
jgi:peptidoglycan/LPS O-acetylase OafA/YrhL